MKAEPQYNDVYYENMTSHSEIMDVVKGNVSVLKHMHVPIDWHQIFGNAQPVEIEIGFGKGRFLLEASRENPLKNYVGVERAKKYVLITRDRFVKYLEHNSIRQEIGLFENVRLVWTDANFFISRYVPHETVHAYHIYFPDPWPKARQQKRRIFRNNEFLDAITRTLNAEIGKLYIATDSAEYFSEIQERLAHYTELEPVTCQECDYRHITTNFERKYMNEGRNIYRAVHKKSSK